MPQAYLKAVRENNQTVNRLFTFLGARLSHAEAGEAVIIAPVSMHFSQGGGMVAGGILAALADEAMAHAVLSLLPEGKAAVTAEMNIRYLRGADPHERGEITATARVVKNGRTLLVAEAVVLGEQDRLLATAGSTFSVIQGRAGAS